MSNKSSFVKKLKIYTGRSLLSLPDKKSDTDQGDSPFEVAKECPIDGCIAAPAVVSSSYIPPDTFTLEEVKQFVGFSSAIEIKYAKPENADDETLLFIKFNSKIDAVIAVGKLISKGSLSVKFRPLFYTHQHGDGPFVKTSSLLVDISKCKLKDFAKVSGVLSHDKLQEVLCVEKDSFQELQQNCRGVESRETYLVWPPWEKYLIGGLTPQDVGAHRFADNEELRFSLRSVYKYAPWVRNIYILTNGQVPSWLNTNHERIKVVTHAEVFRNQSHLPTFSSPSIEANMHNIPGLSEHFLYFNDDVFLGQPVHPEDFISSEGYKVFLAWNIPNCNTGCPANWLTDGYCDIACNISACNFDGGDCVAGSEAVARMANNLVHNNMPVGAASYALNYCNPGCSQSWVGDKYCDPACNVKQCGFDGGDCGTRDVSVKLFEVRLRQVSNSSVIEVPVGVVAMYVNVTLSNVTVTAVSYQSEDQVVRTSVLSLQHKMLSLTFYPNKTQPAHFDMVLSNNTHLNMSLAVNSFPSEVPFVKPMVDRGDGEAVKNRVEVWDFPHFDNIAVDDRFDIGSVDETLNTIDTSRLSEEGLRKDQELLSLVEKGILSEKGRWFRLGKYLSEQELPQRSLKSVEQLPTRHLLDTFANSLHHVNNIYTTHFGKAQRKVLSHMPFLVNKTILNDLQSRFPEEFNKTSANRFRSSDDMQFSFSYFYYLIHSSHKMSAGQFLTEVDRDNDGVFSKGELNILISRIFDLPVSDFNRTLFWDTLRNCTDDSGRNLTTFTPDNILKCGNMSNFINSSLKNVTSYKHEVVDDKDVTFKMLKSNSSKVRIDLDYVRARPRKFTCLNDNMDHGPTYEHLQNLRMLAEFYQTLFPEPSPFEHPPGVRNRYLQRDQLQALLASQFYGFYSPLFFLAFLVAFYICFLKRRTLSRLLRGLVFRVCLS